MAVVGRYLFGADATQAWAEAGVPMIGSLPNEVEDFTNEGVWPITGGALAGAPGVGIALQQAGAETIALITGDVEAGRQLPGLITPALEDEDDLVQETYVSLDPSADYTAQISQLVSANPDGIAVFGSSDINVRVIAGLRSAGYTGLIGMPGTGLSPDGLETLGDAAEGALLVSSFDAPNGGQSEGIAQFNAEMDTYAPDAPRTDLAVNAWASVHLFADLLAGLDTIDPAVADRRPGRVRGRPRRPLATLHDGCAEQPAGPAPDLHSHVPGAGGVGRRDRAGRRRRVPRRERLRLGVIS